MLLEVGSFAALSLSSGALASSKRIREEIAAAARGARTTMPRSEADFGTGIHPYLGFLTRDGPDHQALEEVLQLNQQAFYDADSPIFTRRERVVVVADSSVRRLEMAATSLPAGEGPRSGMQ